jgi:hypothetical protein
MGNVFWRQHGLGSMGWGVLFIASCAMAATDAQLTTLHVFPPNIHLSTARDFQSIVVQARYSDNSTRDVTGDATLAVDAPELMRRDANVFYPLKNGDTRLRVTFEGHAQDVPVRVEKAEQDRPVSFKLDVMPVFMRAQCNTGSCHGSAQGQDGFMLSLFGYDAEGDYKRLTDEYAGRRINLARPEASLMIQKITGGVPHTGGEVFSKDSDYNKTLLRWLRAAAPRDPETVAKPVALEIYPTRIVLAGKGRSQQMTARAIYSDGTDRDVTALAVFFSNNDNSATVSVDGLITAQQRGEAFVMARFATFTEGGQVIAVPDDDTYTWPVDVVPHNYIDERIHEKLQKMHIVPSALCSDEVFVRRVYLDVIGQLPTEQDTLGFLNDDRADKRAHLVDALLARKEFVELWVMKWSELLQIRSNVDFSYKSALLYYNWLRDRIAGNVGFDEIVVELLSASGGTFKNPPTNYYQVEPDLLKTSENVAQVFMGIRMQCAQCHNHPFDRWTMDDYYSFASFFNHIGRKGSDDPREKVVFKKNKKEEVKNPVSKQAMLPRFLGGVQPEIKWNQDRRRVMAEWLVSHENPYFSRNLSNIIWAHFFGQGIVEPVDDVRISNPPSNPELLDELASKLVSYDYDFRKLVRDICLSRTYQLSTSVTASNASDTRNFAKGTIRRIRAEVLLDCISQVTKTQNKFKGLPKGARAVQIADGSTSSYFLTTFGRAKRESVCSCEVVMEPNLSQALHLLNGNATHKKIKNGKVAQGLAKSDLPQKQLLDSLYLISFSRYPTAKERDDIAAYIAAAENKTRGWEDTFWALLNAKEFIFNH